MLVTCGKCGVGFDHKMGRCTACGTDLNVTGEDRIVLLAEEAAIRLRSGIRRDAVRASLTGEHGLADLEAEEVMKRAGATLKHEARSHGRHVVVSGFILLAVAAVVYVIPFPFGRLIAVGSLALGSAMIVLGEIKVMTGWNITGRDDG